MWFWRRASRIPWTERVPNDEVLVLKKVDERKFLVKTTAENRRSMVGHLVHHLNWFTTLITQGGEGPDRTFDEINGGRRYVVIKGLSLKGKKLQATNLLIEEKK